MVKIMSNTNETSELPTDSELDVVTGGLAVTDPTTILACLLSGLFTQGSTLVHEPVHAK
jgi:hypothetical protein